MGVLLEHVAIELRDQLRELVQLRGVLAALVQVQSDLRDELIRSRVVQEDTREALRDLAIAIRSLRAAQAA